MVFGGGGGGRGPKTPFGLSSGTLVTIGFALLVFFAPGVVFGAFNTLFLVRDFVSTCLFIIVPVSGMTQLSFFLLHMRFRVDFELIHLELVELLW